MKIIAHIATDFSEKFGIPRQSGLAENTSGIIRFEPEFAINESVKGLENFEYIWLLWQFELEEDKWSPTVRPPRLGGNKHVGVFASRSPFRPNHIGLSSVKLNRIDYGPNGPILHVSGVDLKDNTAIYDIKPYLPYVDSHPDASNGFAEPAIDYRLSVSCPDDLLRLIPFPKQKALLEVLRLDPRPSYHHDPNRIYGISFAGFNVKFQVDQQVLTVIEINKNQKKL